MRPINITLGLVVDAAAVEALSELITQLIERNARDSVQPNSWPRESRKMTPKEASQRAIFAGQKPPTDRGLLIDSHEVAKLLKVSERTVYRMHTTGDMPLPIRIGRAVRWSLEELQEWIRAGGPRVKMAKKKPVSTAQKQQPNKRMADPQHKQGIRKNWSELYTELELDPADFPDLSTQDIMRIAGDAADALRNWSCRVPMTVDGTNKLRQRLRRFAEKGPHKDEQ